MEKDTFYEEMRKTLRHAYPGKTDDELNKMIDRSFKNFEGIVQGM